TVATGAAQALAQLQARDWAPALLRALAGPAGRSPRFVVAVGAALLDFGAREGEALLKQAARGKDEDARQPASLLLLERPARKARKALLRAPMGEELLLVLGRRARAGDKDALAQLQRALKAETGEAQLRVAEELAHAEDPAGRTLLEETARTTGPL